MRDADVDGYLSTRLLNYARRLQLLGRCPFSRRVALYQVDPSLAWPAAARTSQRPS